MKNQFTSAIVALLLVLGLSSMAMAQTAPTNRPQAQPAAGTKSPWKFYPTDRAIGDGGPAPKRDLTGTWAGPSSGMAVPRGNAQEPKAPPMTPLGQQLFSKIAQRQPVIFGISQLRTHPFESLDKFHEIAIRVAASHLFFGKRDTAFCRQRHQRAGLQRSFEM